jgi:type II secretory pathway pseudopilin PulG
VSEVADTMAQSVHDEPSGRRRTPRHRAGLAIVAGILAAGGVGFLLGHQAGMRDAAEAASLAAAAGAAEDDARLSTAYEACRGSDRGETMTLTDQGRTIVVDTRSEYGSPAGMQCVLQELATPQSTIAAISRTTSMMGVQDDDHDGVAYSWSYHPDNGVNMVITLDD